MALPGAAAGGRGVADDELRGEQPPLVAEAAGESLQQRPAGGRAQGTRRQADGRQRGVEMARQRDVVEPHHRHVRGHPPAGLAERAQRAEGHDVAGHEHRRHVRDARQQPLHRDAAAGGVERALDHEVRRVRQPRGLQGIAVPRQPVRGGGVGEWRVGDARDPPVAERDEVLHGGPGAGAVVDVHAGRGQLRQRPLEDDREAVLHQRHELCVVRPRAGHDQAVHPLRAHEVAVAPAVRRQRLHQHPVAAFVGLGADAPQRLGQQCVHGHLLRRLAQHQPDGVRGAAGQGPCRAVRVIAKFPGGILDPPPGLVRDRHPGPIVEHERDGGPGHPGARGHVGTRRPRPPHAHRRLRPARSRGEVTRVSNAHYRSPGRRVKPDFARPPARARSGPRLGATRAAGSRREGRWECAPGRECGRGPSEARRATPGCASGRECGRGRECAPGLRPSSRAPAAGRAAGRLPQPTRCGPNR